MTTQEQRRADYKRKGFKLVDSIAYEDVAPIGEGEVLQVAAKVVAPIGEECWLCNGTGGMMVLGIGCTLCGGAGEVVTPIGGETCTQCHGKGFITVGNPEFIHLQTDVPCVFCQDNGVMPVVAPTGEGIEQ